MALRLVGKKRGDTAYYEFAGVPSDGGPLEVSIEEKWKPIVELLRRDPLASVFDGGCDTCPLCQAFENCIGCPVRRATGCAGCVGSPYDDWFFARSLETAEAELAFLEGLRQV